MQSASELNELPSERWAGACQPLFRHGAWAAGRSVPPAAAYAVHASSLAKLPPPAVTSVCQPFFWHFFALAELPPPASAVPAVPSAATSRPTTSAVKPACRKARIRLERVFLLSDIGWSPCVVSAETGA